LQSADRADGSLQTACRSKEGVSRLRRWSAVSGNDKSGKSTPPVENTTATPLVTHLFILHTVRPARTCRRQTCGAPDRRSRAAPRRH